MSKNVGNVSVLLSARFDRSGIDAMIKDVTSSKRLIEGMSESGRGPAVHPMAAAMADANKSLMAQANADQEKLRYQEWLKNNAASASQQELQAIAEQKAARAELMAQDRARDAARKASESESTAYQNWLKANTSGQTQQELQAITEQKAARAELMAQDRARDAARKASESESTAYQNWLKANASGQTQQELQAIASKKSARDAAMEDEKRQSAERIAMERQQALAAKANAMNAGNSAAGLSPDLKNSFAEEAANRQKQLDKEVWAARGRQHDEQIQKETELAAKRQRTEAILSQARILGTQKESQALVQKYNKAEAEAQTLAAIEKTRHQQALDFIFQEGDAASGRMLGGIAGKKTGSTTADNNRNNAGFQGAQMVQQLGFGLQDFTSQLMNSKTLADGLGRGIMAVSNNVQMLGAAFGATGLAITAVGGAVAGIVLPQVIKWLSATEDLEKVTERIKENVNHLSEMSKNVIEIRVKGGANNRVEALKDDEEIAKAQRKSLEKRADEADQRIRSSRARERTMREDGARAFDLPTDKQAQVNKNTALRDELDMQQRAAIESKQLGEQVDKESGKAQDAAHQRKMLQSQAEFERDLEVKEKIAKFNAEENTKSVQQQDEALREKRAKIEQEMSFLEGKRATASVQDRQWIDREMEDRRKAMVDNDAVIAGTREKVETASQQAIAEAQGEAFKKADEKQVKAHRKDFDKQILAENEKQFEMQTNLDKLHKLDQTPNGSSAANVRGTGAAVSAINRAIAGTNSEESDRKKQIKLMEDQLKSSQNIERKLNLQRAAL